jgi:hypothetical protein
MYEEKYMALENRPADRQAEAIDEQGSLRYCDLGAHCVPTTVKRMQMSMSKLVFYSCLVFGAVAGITGIALLSGDKTLAQNQQGQGPSRVIVTNTPLPVQATNPLPVTVTNQPAPAAVIPFQGQCTLLLNGITEGSCPIAITPPVGKQQLVVQAVSVALAVSGGVFPVVTQIQEFKNSATPPATPAVFHNFPLFAQLVQPGNGTFAGLQSLTWILDPTATSVRCYVLVGLQTPLGSEMFCNVTGYYQ